MGLFGRLAGTRTASGVGRAELARLREWVASRGGVEVYVEPATSTSSMTMLLVAHDGESTRGRVGSAKEAADFARKAGIPVYDTNRVGVPQRKRDYDVRQARSATTRPSGGTSARPTPSGPNRQEREAVATLARIAGTDVGEHADRDAQQRLLRRARAQAHPDRRGGDRSDWDAVEAAARTLRLDL